MSGSISATPPPPSPSESEAPPSYDSLSPPPGISYPHPHTHFPSSLPHHHSSDSVISRGAEEIQTISPPPPYSLRRWSLGLSRASHSLQRQAIDGESSPNSLSLFGRIQEAHQHSTNSFVFLRRLSRILLSTVCCLVVLIAFLSIPLTVLVLGVVFVDDCPLQPDIPIFLIVGGLSVMLELVILIIYSIVLRNSTSLSTRFSRSKHKVLVCGWKVFSITFNLFLLAWTVAGSYWVYSKYKEVIKFGYLTCNEVVYKFTFSVIALSYVIFLMALCCACCFAGILCFGRGKRSGPPVSNFEEGTSGSDWVMARGDVVAGLCAVENERQQEDDRMTDASYRDDDGDVESMTRMNHGSVSEQVPVRSTPLDLASNREPDSVGGEEDVSINSQVFSATLPLESLDSEAAGGRTRLANLSLRSPGANINNQVLGTPTFMVEGAPISNNLRRHARTSTGSNYNDPVGLQQAHSNTITLDSVPDHSFKRNRYLSDRNGNEAFKNATSSYVNLMPQRSARHALMGSECAHSNPVLYDPNQQSLQRRQPNKAQTMASGDHHSAHLRLPSGSYPHRDCSRSSLRGADINGSSLYITIQSEGCSSTHV